MASDLIMGTALVGPDLRPGRYEVESVPAGSAGAAAIRLDYNFMTIADYAYETTQGVAFLTVTVESTDCALHFLGTLRHLD